MDIDYISERKRIRTENEKEENICFKGKKMEREKEENIRRRQDWCNAAPVDNDCQQGRSVMKLLAIAC